MYTYAYMNVYISIHIFDTMSYDTCKYIQLLIYPITYISTNKDQVRMFVYECVYEYIQIHTCTCTNAYHYHY
jgi:hypothetical protein